MGRDEINASESELEQVRARTARMYALLAVAGIAGMALHVVPAAMVAIAISDGIAEPLLTGLFTVVIGAPAIVFAVRSTRKQTLAGEAAMDHLRAELTQALEDADAQATRRESAARHQDFESQLSNALEMAGDEGEVIDVVQRAFVETVGGADAELLLADNSHAHLSRMAVSASAAGSTMCTVESPDACPAARRAQVQRFADSDALDACPKLRHRDGGRCSAVCVPVSIMGRTVGVIHVTGRVDELPADGGVHDLATLAKNAGARIGLLRMMADTQLQASTDSLTGLLNRRALENTLRRLRAQHATFAVAIADLDHFKQLNDTYGHETGDRAIRVFAQTMRANVRDQDVVARYGGEEFVIVFPSCAATGAAVVLERMREALAVATMEAGLPTVTASFGVVDALGDDDLVDAVARADAALLEAKCNGRDRVVRHSSGDTLDEVLTAL